MSDTKTFPVARRIHRFNPQARLDPAKWQRTVERLHIHRICVITALNGWSFDGIHCAVAGSGTSARPAPGRSSARATFLPSRTRLRCIEKSRALRHRTSQLLMQLPRSVTFGRLHARNIRRQSCREWTTSRTDGAYVRWCTFDAFKTTVWSWERTLGALTSLYLTACLCLNREVPPRCATGT